MPIGKGWRLKFVGLGTRVLVQHKGYGQVVGLITARSVTQDQFKGSCWLVVTFTPDEHPPRTGILLDSLFCDWPSEFRKADPHWTNPEWAMIESVGPAYP